MKVLLSDGSGLTARQCATRLAEAGHHVEVLAPDPLCLCRFTRHVRRVNPVPSYGQDPFGWLEAALAVYREGGFDVLLPTQEQVAVLSVAAEHLARAGVATAVPPFGALQAVQDKLAAAATLARLGVPQPPHAVGPEGWDVFPAFVKDPIGTASGGVRQVSDTAALRSAARGRRVLVQEGVEGPLVMCQSLFDHGALVAFHANLRVREGANGGASHKKSIVLPEVRRCFEVLGAGLDWHGALSADVILARGGPVFIDVNPRLVEPQNAWFAGVDLVGGLLELARSAHPRMQAPGRAGVASHQLLLSILGTALHGEGRRGVAHDLLRAWRGRDAYRDSTEELTPVRGDPRSAALLAVTAAALLAAPSSASWFSGGSLQGYALSAEGWEQILAVGRSGASFGP